MVITASPWRREARSTTIRGNQGHYLKWNIIDRAPGRDRRAGVHGPRVDGCRAACLAVVENQHLLPPRAKASSFWQSGSGRARTGGVSPPSGGLMVIKSAFCRMAAATQRQAASSSSSSASASSSSSRGGIVHVCALTAVHVCELLLLPARDTFICRCVSIVSKIT